MTELEWNCLAMARIFGPLTLKALALRLGLQSTDIGMTCGQLFHLGLLRVSPDGKFMDVSDAGRKRFSQLVKPTSPS